MTGVRCSGSELDVTDCPHSDDVTGCDVTESAAVSCLPDTSTPPPRTINTVYFTSLCVISFCTYSLFETRCKPKPGCSPTGYPPRRLLIIVECQLTGLLPSSAALALLVVSRRTRVSGKCLRGKCPGGVSVSRGSMSVPRCTGVVSSNRRRSTSCITRTTVERVVDECTQFITHWSL